MVPQFGLVGGITSVTRAVRRTRGDSRVAADAVCEFLFQRAVEWGGDAHPADKSAGTRIVFRCVVLVDRIRSFRRKRCCRTPRRLTRNEHCSASVRASREKSASVANELDQLRPRGAIL